MSDLTSSPQVLNAQPDNSSFSINYKRVSYWALSYWYLILLSIILGITTAYIINRYSTKIYLVSASILIKEEGEVSGSELLYNNPLVDIKRNYLNELYIIKSYPLVENVLDKLNFGVAFYKEGNFLTSEIYDMPIDVKILNPEMYPGSSVFYFTAIDNGTFALSEFNDNDIKKTEVYRYNDTLRVHGLNAIFTVKAPQRLTSIKGNIFIFKYSNPAVLAVGYVNRVNATWAESGAGVINLSISGSDPEKEKAFLSGFIRYYQEFDLDKKNETAAKTIAFISDQLSEIADSLKHVENQLEQFKDKHVVTELGAETQRLYQKVEDLEVQRAQLLLAGNYYVYLTDYLNKEDNPDQIILPTSLGITDPMLGELVSQLVERQMVLKLGREANPRVEGVRMKIKELKLNLLEAIRNLKDTDLIKRKYLDQQIGIAEKQLGYLPLAERKLVSIQRNYTLLENLYVFLLQKKSEAAITQASNTSDIILVNPPMAGAAIAPRTTRNYALAFLIGLMLPFIIFAGVELFNTRVQSREDIEKLTSIPFIGGLGHKRGDSNLEVLIAPKTAIAESFRALRSNLNYFLGKKEKVVILVTSSISGEGKTFTSINLASIFSLSGKKVLLVGADLRKPKIYQDFGATNAIGLSTYLSGMSPWKEIVQSTGYTNLDLISGGPVPPNPSELLLSPEMEQFIREVKEVYDYVVIDTPPIAIVADAFALTSFADHTLFMIRQNYTSKELLKTTQEMFASGKLNHISVVLNDIYRNGPGYGYGIDSYGYGYGYGYESKSGHGYYE